MTEHESHESSQDGFSGKTLAAELKQSTEKDDLPEKTQKQLEAISELADLPVVATGGYAEEAHLHSKVTREHHDIDMFALRGDAGTIEAALRERGYEVSPQKGVGDKIYKLIIRKGGVEGDVVFLDQDDQTRKFIDLRNQNGAEYRLFIDDSLDQQATLEGHTFRVVSPKTLIQQRQAVLDSGRFEPREHDLEIQQALKDKFFADVSEEVLKPEILRTN